MAVGGFANRGGRELALAERWNGKRWSIDRMPDPAAGPTGSILNRVSCASRSLCIAVGFFQAHTGPDELPLVELWNGKRWSLQRAPSPHDAYIAYLNSVSCVPTDACTAVGVFSATHNRGRGIPLVEHWNGRRWSIQQTPNPAPINSELDGVSCASRTACTAVGEYAYAGPGLAEFTLAEHWNGKRWSIQHTPSPGPGPGGLAGSTEDSLRGVSCVSISSCTAAGATSAGAGPQVLVEAYHRARWSVSNTPNSSGVQQPQLQDVSCRTTGFCVGVGCFGFPCAPLAMQTAGNGWSIELPPLPTNSTGGLGGVSCVSTKDCIAVGAFTPTGSSQTQTLAERDS